MEIDLTPGKYVVAVSGGVDSVVLLDLLRRLSDVRLIVAHFDHGIRAESMSDRQFVQELAEGYGLPFVYDEGHLGVRASEAVAREARYKFLRQVMRSADADAIITAHHEDDMLETAILNLLRGTGRKGLSSIKNTGDVHRPFLNVSKRQIIAYAKSHELVWREDATNMDTGYSRNYVRHTILPRFSVVAREQLRARIVAAHSINVEIDALIAEQLGRQPSADALDRNWLIMLPHMVAREVVAAWLRAHGIREFDKKAIERITVAVKTYLPGKRIDVNDACVIKVEKHKLALAARER